MVTPRSASRARRLANDGDGLHVGRSAPRSNRGTRGRRSSNRHDDDSSDSDYDFWDQVDEDPREELVRQMDALCATTMSDSGPRLELASHIPLNRIKLFSKRRNKSDNSIQWLKTFEFEMKGTRTRPDEWCAAFERSLRDDAIHWFRQLPKKNRRKWKPLSQAFIDYYCTQYKQSPAARYYAETRQRKEHICDYLNRLKGYARNARLQVEKGQRDAKDHVEQFLLTCGDDRLMQDLSRLRLNDIRELEEVLTTLLKWEERLVARGATQQSRYEGDSYRRGDARNRSESRSNSRERRDYDRHDRRDYDRGDRRERREQDRPREDIRRAPRVTFAEAEERDWVADLNGRRPNTRRASTRRDVWSDSKDGGSSAGDFESSCSDDSSSDDDQRQLVAANESERRSAGEGTYARADRRFRRNDQAGRGDSRERPDTEHRERDNRRRSFGPCAACGGRNHSAHYCNRRCK
ncbi:hypothetical protein PC129_g22876 [Phytophthora cactorum]|uniref:Retrotransposon gag domain-containing protein n=3 Tax=Phytophthora cactorum TaxID=29920 RepID=A0A8T0Y4D0_9STRA|nr:hypothetical protein Pcac1_g4998 [Phytophthora cactorum]KAG2800896.1 hypothetical protein PC112_g20279 [Phytophthora cactorum]KAG2826018.1 hypothetical protein PC113_g21839 [Phytophthora cactorum]KAG2880164.1 hypothetical protein PC114_g22207 [Phytophthora cactorum]KAG2889263.1 hypothetical protein PC115_g19794 [Phytophthora cactorum]